MKHEDRLAYDVSLYDIWGSHGGEDVDHAGSMFLRNVGVFRKRPEVDEGAEVSLNVLWMNGSFLAT
jgi:hypothetical protein